jgi:hypothetical protein
VPIGGAETPNNRVLVGVMGTSRNSAGGDGRGTELAVELASIPGVEVGYICDVDERNVPKAIESVGNRESELVSQQAYPGLRARQTSDNGPRTRAGQKRLQKCVLRKML